MAEAYPSVNSAVQLQPARERGGEKKGYITTMIATVALVGKRADGVLGFLMDCSSPVSICDIDIPPIT